VDAEVAGMGTLYRLDVSDFHAVVNLGCLDVGVQLCVQRHTLLLRAT